MQTLRAVRKEGSLGKANKLLPKAAAASPGKGWLPHNPSRLLSPLKGGVTGHSELSMSGAARIPPNHLHSTMNSFREFFSLLVYSDT